MAATTDLNAGMRCVKYLLFLFNLLFVLTGVLIITVGVSINALYHDYIEFLDSRYLPPTTLLIITGFIIFFVAFFGCCGAVRESTCMIMMFSVMLGLVFILEFSAGIAAYMLHDGLSDMLFEKLNSTMYDYEINNNSKETVDFLQTQMGCCGIYEPGDWAVVGLPHGMPESCCSTRETFSYLDGMTDIGACPTYEKGCLRQLEFLIGQSALLLATAAMSIALLQVLGVLFGCSLGRSIRVHKTERLRRRQELQEQLINSYTYLGTSDPQKTYPVVYMGHDNGISNA